MPDPTYSSAAWTGPPEAMSAPYRATFTHSVGAPGVTTNYAYLREKARLAERFPEELRPVVRSAVLLLVSQLSLWISSVILNATSDDWRITDLSGFLSSWAFGAIIISVWQFKSLSRHWVPLRRAMLALLVLATFVMAVGNVYLGLTSKIAATASRPERVYVLFGTRGRGALRRTIANFQRADGSFVDGRPATAPIDYGKTCALVQRLDRPNGFSWIKVRQWSRVPSGQLAWPIRREE